MMARGVDNFSDFRIGTLSMNEVQSNVVEKVTLSIESGELVANIHSSESGDGIRYAFFFFKDGERIHASMREKSPSCRFDVGGLPGFYEVTAIVKQGKEKLGSKRSAPVLVAPPPIGAGSLQDVSSRDRVILFKGKRYTYSALHWPGGEDALFVLMTTPIADLYGTRPPVFNRWNWARKGIFPGTVLCVSDPRVDRSVRESDDYRGNGEHYPFDDLVLFIEEFASARGIPRDKITIWGSSGGGLAALYVAARIEGATAVAINAQTDVLGFTFRPEILEAVRRIYFDGLPDEVLAGRFPQGMDMVKAWAANQRSRCVLVQNCQDVHHYKHQFPRLWEFLGGRVNDGWSRSGRHLAYVYSNPGKHAPETLDVAHDILAHLSEDSVVDA